MPRTAETADPGGSTSSVCLWPASAGVQPVRGRSVEAGAMRDARPAFACHGRRAQEHPGMARNIRAWMAAAMAVMKAAEKGEDQSVKIKA